MICHFKADTYNIKPARRSLSRVNGLKEGRNNRTMFSKISLNLIIVGFVTMVTDNSFVVQAV